MSNYTYFVSGKVYTRVYGATSAFEWPGLVDSLELSINENVINLADRTQTGGGNYGQVRRVESMNVTLNHREFRPSVLARALFGTSTENAGAAVVAEEHIVTLGGFVPLDNPGPYTLLTVTDDATAPGAVSTDNYTVTKAGLLIPETAPDLVDDDGILVSYTHPAYTRTQALVATAPEIEIFFEGLNEADSDNPRPARFHRVRLGPAAAMQLLSGDDFGELSLSGEVLKDLTKTGTGISQYFYSDIVSP